MSGRVRELVVTCDACGWTDRLTMDDLPDYTPINCGPCGHFIGLWGKLKSGAVIMEQAPTTGPRAVF